METIFPPFPSFSLPQHAWLGMCEGLLASSAGRASWGPPWCSHMLALDTVVTLGQGQCQRGFGWLLSCLLSLPTPLGHGRSVWVFARWSLSVCPFLWPLFALLVFTGWD